MSFPRYAEYKDSGVEWLGAVPAHWTLMRLKALVVEVDQRADGADFELLGLSKSLGVVGRSELEQGASESDNYAKYKVADAGHLVMNKMQAWNGVFGLSPRLGMTSPDYAVFQFIKSEYDKFLCSLFRTELMAGVFFTRCRGMGTAFLRLNTPDFLDVKVPLPPVDEAKGVIKFLDHETTKIDALVAEQEKLIALLKEKRQAVISHAVTKGLNPDAPMKDSGIEWLGAVPAHWEVRRVKSVSNFTTSGPRGWSERVADEGSLFVQSGDLNDELEVEFAGSKRVQVDDDAEASRTLLCDGDVVVCITGAKTGNVAVCAEVPEPAYINQHLCLIRPTQSILPGFLGILLKSTLGQTYFELSQYGLKQGLSLEDVREAPVLLPPLAEQFAIATYINAETNRFDTLRIEAQRAGELLKERRSALISAAVTGKIDVRGFAAEREAA